MKRPVRVGIILIFMLITWLPSSRAVAFPVLPSSFYGSVKHNGANIPDGTLVEALIDEQVLAYAYAQTYQGGSVYALDVRGDDSETPSRDGGREGDVVHFRVGGKLASQTGVWHSGTNSSLDLSIQSPEQLARPQPTPSLPATQTAVVILQLPSSPASTLMPEKPSQAPTSTQEEIGRAVLPTASAVRAPGSPATIVAVAEHPAAAATQASIPSSEPLPVDHRPTGKVIVTASAVLLLLVGIIYYRRRW